MRKCVPPPETLEIKDVVEKISTECYSWNNYHSPEALAATHLPPPVYGIQRQVVLDGHLAMDLDPDLEEFVGAEGKSPFVPSKSLGKRPLSEVEVKTEVPSNTLATNHERDRLAEEEPHTDTNEEVATKLAQYLSYFRKDAIAHFASHPTELPSLLSTLCPSDEAALPLFHMFRDDPGYHKGKKGMQQNLYRTLENALPDDWEEVHAVLPDDLTLPGPEPFSKPPTNLIDPSATSLL
nr:hypothetical protein Iba_chr12dCG11270 [Ipomoea batatas]